MAHIVILGAGIGGLPMAYEMKQLARPEDRVTVVSNTSTFHFVPSNPWVGVNWRGRWPAYSRCTIAITPPTTS